MEQSNERKFLVLKIIAFQSRAANFQNPEEDACHWQSMCYETYLTFNISLKEIFSESDSLIVMEKFDKSVLMLILQEFGTI